MDREKSGKRCINSSASQKGVEMELVLTHTARDAASRVREPQVALRQPRRGEPGVSQHSLSAQHSHVYELSSRNRKMGQCVTTEAWKTMKLGQCAKANTAEDRRRPSSPASSGGS